MTDLDWHGFARIYTGRVIANLKSDDGQSRMRCRFIASDARAGLSAGASGDCELSSGESIEQVVAAPS
jgi:hypothetical protein